MRPYVCNATQFELTATPDKTVHYADEIVIYKRDAAVYEACHWIVAADTD